MSRTFTYMEQLERDILKEDRETLWQPFCRAVKKYRLIQPGDRIAVCISGGKDSMLLAKLIQLLHRHSEVPFEAVYLIMDPGYNPENRARVESNARLLGIPYTLFESDVFEVANAQDKNPCFLCARMRRGVPVRKGEGIGLQQNRPGAPL